MEKKLEKALKKGLDKILQGTLENYYRLMSEKLLDLVESREDFLLGVVVGDMLEGLCFCTYGSHKRYPTDEELKDFFKMIQRRSKEIQVTLNSLLAK